MLDDIEYSFYNYRVTWEEAKIICLGYKSQLVTLDTEKKVFYVTKQLENSNLDFEEFWIGSKKNLRGDWIWDTNDKKLLLNTFVRESITTVKYQNSLAENDSQCLTVIRRHYHLPLLIPRCCFEQKPFICERDPFSTSNFIKVLTINAEEKGLVLYSANVTWSEAVFYCRQQGLQIAEILTLTEARSMAVGMLKVRPRSIESAWIAGYINERVWKWLPSGAKIPQNELWQDSHVHSGNCLLLERHICERPRYLSLRCDRRRNFICQTLQKEEFNRDPVQVTIDDCKYWINVIPLNWHKANQLCKNFNSTLVSLDSPATVTHVVNIMFHNKELLRHIWIGGKKASDLNNSTVEAVWKWNNTGSTIPDHEQGFVPWYKDSRLFEQNSDCLNMDLEDVDEPIVYGLNCNNKQRYLCQEESVTCTQMKNKSTADFNHFDATSRRNSTSSSFNETDKLYISEYHNNNNESTEVSQNASKSSEISLIVNNQPREIFNKPLKDNAILNNENIKSNVREFHNNSEPSLTVNNKNFKEIIEYMMKKVNDGRSETIHNTSINSLSKLPTSQFYDKSVNSNLTNKRPSKTGHALSVKENISKIVQSSIEKNLQNITSTTPSMIISNLENPVTYISSSYTESEIEITSSPTPRSLFRTQVDRRFQKNQEKLVKSITSQNYDSTATFNLTNTIRSTFNNDPLNGSTESMNAEEKYKVKSPYYSNLKNKNEINTVRATSTIEFEKKIQSLKNNSNTSVKINDIVNDFQLRMHDKNLKQELLSLSDNNVVGSKNNNVIPLNVLLKRIVQSYNNTNKNLIGFKVLELP